MSPQREQLQLYRLETKTVTPNHDTDLTERESDLNTHRLQSLSREIMNDAKVIQYNFHCTFNMYMLMTFIGTSKNKDTDESLDN